MEKKLLLKEWDEFVAGIRLKFHLNPRDDKMLKKFFPNMYEMMEKIRKGEIDV